MQKYAPNEWQSHTLHQGIKYPSHSELSKVVQKLSKFPPLVSQFEVDRLHQYLAQAALGKCFILQGGDCAESFENCDTQTITNQLKILLQMSLILIHGLRKPIVRVGRIAGQYAKPRSSDIETRDGITLPSYRGDLINHIEFTEKMRTPDPQLMIKGYSFSAMTLNYLRALIESGFADLQHPEYWDLDFAKHSPFANEYQRLTKTVTDALAFLKTFDGIRFNNINRVDFYTSHEALHLYYEQALTRQSDDGRWYNLSTHFPWIGMRTAVNESAHIEYMRGIANPIGVKIGPNIDLEWLKQMVKQLNPGNKAGRLTLITRLGTEKVKQYLAQIIQAVQETGIRVVWFCDPMHGNTHKTKSGIKTRRFDDILSELQMTFEIHQHMNSYLGGMHLELTGENVTECIGGARGLKEEDLKRSYKSLVDPRLNYEQSLETAMLIAKNALGNI